MAIGVFFQIGITPASAESKLIYFGWSTRDTRYIRQHWREMEQMPFDGTTIHVAIDRSKPTQGDSATENMLGWHLFGPRTFQLKNFQPAIDDLKVARWTKFADNFLVVCTCSDGQAPGFDWFDDARWNKGLENWKVLVAIAKAAGCKGIFLDTEQYGKAFFFTYQEMNQKYKHPLPDYQAKLRQRGRELGAAATAIYPQITILTLFGHSYVALLNEAKNTNPATGDYRLVADFLDGILEGLGPQATYFDGFEPSYAYKDDHNFKTGHELIVKKGLACSQVPTLYRKKVKVGFGLFMDYIYQRPQWWFPDNVSKNFFTPDQFGQALHYANKYADGYIWIYTERAQFFPPAQLPQAYIEAIRKAKQY